MLIHLNLAALLFHRRLAEIRITKVMDRSASIEQIIKLPINHHDGHHRRLRLGVGLAATSALHRLL